VAKLGVISISNQFKIKRSSIQIHTYTVISHNCSW
jgi:hypothetical protein